VFYFFMRVKICGITNLEDALLACELGADAIGLIFYENSPRCIAIEQARAIVAQLPEHVAKIGVFVNTPPDDIRRHIERVGLTAVQFHGDYALDTIAQFPPETVIAVVRVGKGFQAYTLQQFHDTAAAVLLDTQKRGVYGGTGETFDWQAAIDAKAFAKIILAGGLHPDNIAEAAAFVQPYALDISSGVEASPGKKDHAKLHRLFAQLAPYLSTHQTGRFPYD